MNFTEAIEILKKPNERKIHQEIAIETIKEEIITGSSLTLSLVANEIKQSLDPVLSYQLMRALLNSGTDRIESNVLLRSLFINKTLASESVKDGLWKCMVALAACTRAVDD